MKKIGLLMALFALCCSCDDSGEISVECSPPIYTSEFMVKNEIDKDIVISYDRPGEPDVNPVVIVINSGKSDMVYDMGEAGSCYNIQLLKDVYEDDYRICLYENPKYPFTMTIAGSSVSDEIWLRKYWSFTATYFSRTYTLTVTEELLASLPAEEVSE